MMIRSPAKRSILAVCTIPVTMTAPLVVGMHFWTRWIRGDYPSNADSIGLPIFGYAIFVWPVCLTLLGAALIRHVGSLPLWNWRKDRPFRSIAVSLLFLWAARWVVFMVIECVQQRAITETVFWLAELYVLLLLRAESLGKSNQMQNEASDMTS